MTHFHYVTNTHKQIGYPKCVDPKLNNEYPPKAIVEMAAVAALCVQYETDFSPNMKIVVKALLPLLNSKPAAGSESHALRTNQAQKLQNLNITNLFILTLNS
ncbi:unnamed protein product [Cuscuta epithymum]|uniref:Uncharacterized protein n=1 Tax=Cuscuta epithymum TaxID=186058 RepID=A0AAV0F9Q5_9ASTE|nr:unnamed protein product [Cuscuta epithymum]